MLIVLPHLHTDLHTNYLHHRLVPVTFVRRQRCGFWRYGKGGVENWRCGKWMSELWRNRGIVGQRGIKTGHKAVKSHTSLVLLLMRQVVMFLAVFLAAQIDPVQWCSLPLHLLSCHREAMVREVPTMGMRPLAGNCCEGVVQESVKLLFFWYVKYTYKIGRQVFGREIFRSLLFYFPLLAFRIILTHSPFLVAARGIWLLQAK